MTAKTIYNDDFTVADFEAGDLVELHPATDAWMQGDRFGMVSKVGRKYIHVSLDRSERILQFMPKYVGQRIAEPTNRECEAAVHQYLKQKHPMPDAKVFYADGVRVSTRSSNPHKRRLAKKILREVEKQNGPR